MTFEKSCGTVPYTIKENTVYYLLIKSETGICGFPKGHMEGNESEVETALRETWEETSVKVTITDGFRHEIIYPLSSDKKKIVVYFPASYANQSPAHNKGFENYDYLLLPFSQACDALSFENTKEVLKRVNDYLNW